MSKTAIVDWRAFQDCQSWGRDCLSRKLTQAIGGKMASCQQLKSKTSLVAYTHAYSKAVNRQLTESSLSRTLSCLNSYSRKGENDSV